MEQEIYTFKVSYFEKLRTLNDLANVLNEFRCKLGQFHSPTNDEKEVLDNLSKLLTGKREEIIKLENEAIDFFSSKLQRFWRMKIISFDSTGKFKHENEYEIYPYELFQENHYLACLRLDHDYYSSSFSDNGFMLDDLLCKDCTIELQEISKDDFFLTFNKYANEVITRRFEKLNVE